MEGEGWLKRSGRDREKARDDGRMEMGHARWWDTGTA